MRDSMKHGSSVIGFGALVLCCAGCLGTPARDSLAGIQDYQARKLAAECYRTNEGLRAVQGDHIIWHACERWADARVKPRAPSSL